MFQYGYDLKVADWELRSIAECMNRFYNDMENVIDQYNLISQNIIQSAVVSGEAHNALVLYQKYIEELKQLVGDLGSTYTAMTERYIKDLEDADDHLYDASIADMIRDFSEKEYTILMECLDDIWYEKIFENFGGKWLFEQFCKLDFFKKEVQLCRDAVILYNGETKASINQIYEAVYGVDRDYGASNPGYSTAYFGYVSLSISSIRNILREMAYIMNPKNGAFTTDAITARLEPEFEDVREYLELADSFTKESMVTDDDVKNFMSQIWAKGYFINFNQIANSFILNIGVGDTIKMQVFKAFDLTESLFYTDYEQYLLYNQLLKSLKSLAVDKAENVEEAQETLKESSDFIKLIKEYGDEWYKYMNNIRYSETGRLILDGRTKEARYFREALSSLGSAAKLLNLGNDAIEYVVELAADYSKGMELLESFERNYAGNESLLNCVQQVKDLYQKESLAWFGKAVEDIVDLGWETAMEIAVKECSVFAIVDKIGETIDLVGERTGLGDEADAMYEALSYSQLCGASNEAYANAVEKLADVSPTDANYTTLLNDAKNCFELNKLNLTSMFQSMIEASNGTERSYYEYCLDALEKTSMKDTTYPTLLDYDEYLAAYGG